MENENVKLKTEIDFDKIQKKFNFEQAEHYHYKVGQL